MTLRPKIFSKRRKVAILGMGTALCLLAAPAGTLFGSSASASSGGNNNKGDVWVDNVGQPSGPGHEMDPHLACADINLWGSAIADPSGTYTIDGWPPSGSMTEAYPGPTAPTAAPYALPGQPAGNWVYSGPGSHVMQVISVTALIANAIANGDAPINKQGFHFKLQYSLDPQKHKTFWVNCPTPGQPSTRNCYPTKTVSPPTAMSVGAKLTYTVTATNNSTVNAPCSVDDVLSLAGGATYAVITPPSNGTASQGTVTGTDPTYKWNVGTLSPGQQATLTMVVQALAPGTITNTASIPASECTPTVETPCVAVVHTPVTPLPSMNCYPTKTVLPTGTVTTNTTLTYTVTAINNSTVDAPCTVNDVFSLSGGATFSGPTNTTMSQGSLVSTSSPNFTWNVGTLTPGQHATLTMVVDALTVGTITNTASVPATDCVSSMGAPCTATVATPVVLPPGSPSFTVVKTVQPSGSVPTGTVLHYTVTVTNSGGSAGSPTAAIADQLTLTGGATYSVDGGPSVTAGTVGGRSGNWTWDLTSTRMTPGQVETFTLAITALTAGTLTNTAVLPNSNCPSAKMPAPCTTTTPVNLILTKTVSETTGKIGDTVKYVITLTNPTNNAASNVSVTDLMSGTASFVVNDGTNGTLNSFLGSPAVTINKVATDTYTWVYNTVPAESQATVTYTILITDVGTTATSLNGHATVINTASTAGVPPVTVVTTVPSGPGGVLGISTTTPSTGALSKMNTTIAGFLLFAGLTLLLLGSLARKPEPIVRR